MFLIIEKLLKFLKKEMGISLTEEAQKAVASDLEYRSPKDFLQSGIDEKKYCYESNRVPTEKSPLFKLNMALNNNVLSYNLGPQELWQCIDRARPLRVGEILDDCLNVYKHPFHEKETFTAMNNKIDIIMFELQSLLETEGLQSLLMMPVGDKKGRVNKETIAEAMVKALHPELHYGEEFNQKKEIYSTHIQKSIETQQKEKARN